MSELAVERRDYFPAAYHGGTRENQPSGRPPYDVIVIHSDETGDAFNGAERTAQYFHGPTSRGSTQLAVDENSCQRCLDDATEAAGAPPYNDRGLHVEQGGRAAWSREEWLKRPREIERCAYKVAEWCKKYDIPAVWLEIDDLKRAGAYPSKPLGITSHNNCSEAFQQSSHWDPGPDYPYDVFMDHVRRFVKGEEDDMPPSKWTKEDWDVMAKELFGVDRNRLKDKTQVELGRARFLQGETPAPGDKEQQAGFEAEKAVDKHVGDQA